MLLCVCVLESRGYVWVLPFHRLVGYKRQVAGVRRVGGRYSTKDLTEACWRECGSTKYWRRVRGTIQEAIQLVSTQGVPRQGTI